MLLLNRHTTRLHQVNSRWRRAMVAHMIRERKILNMKPFLKVGRYLPKRKPYSENETVFWCRNDILELERAFERSNHILKYKRHSETKTRFWRNALSEAFCGIDLLHILAANVNGDHQPTLMCATIALWVHSNHKRSDVYTVCLPPEICQLECSIEINPIPIPCQFGRG